MFARVMDGAGPTQAAIVGWSEARCMAALSRCTYSNRVRALVLHATYPRAIQDDAFPEGWLPRARMEEDLEEIERSWSSGQPGAGSHALGPEANEAQRRWFSRMLRMAASPGAAVALAKMDYATDIRPVLPSIHVQSGDGT